MLTMKQKQAVAREVALRYKKARKKEKGVILNELTKITGYNRSYAARVLREKIRPKVVGKKRIGDLNVILVEDRRRKRKRLRARRYDKKVFKALKKIWIVEDCICGKRLAPFLPEIVPVLEKFKELNIDKETREKLLNISAATIDRMLAETKKGFQLKSGLSTTKPGTLLKNQIPIRTFADWDDKRPGFFEVDLVAHCGESVRGEYINSLNFTDVASGWVEPEAVMGRSQFKVFKGIEKIEQRLPFPLLGIDSDNDSPFINAHLFNYCQEKEITFTRCRANKKNDQCHVEQKNYSVIRRAVGYSRYDTKEELKVISELYRNLRLYINFFQPVMKLKEKQRVGPRVKKKYDIAKTPYQRILESKDISLKTKRKLKIQYDKLNPAQLKRKITKLQNKLMKLTLLKEKLRRARKEKKGQEIKNDFEYFFDESTNHRFEYFFK